MSLCAEITVSPADAGFGRVFSDVDVRVEFDQLVPTGDRFLPYLWIDGPEEAVDRFEDRVARVDAVANVAPPEDRDSSRLYWVDWETRPDGVFAAADRSDASIKRAVGTPTGWGLRLQAADRSCLASFRDECVDRSITFTLERLHAPRPTGVRGSKLTGPQRVALKLAHGEGYYDVPRSTTLERLGARLDVSRQAVSYRLRRGTKRLVEEVLVDPGDPLDDRFDELAMRTGVDHRS